VRVGPGSGAATVALRGPVAAVARFNSERRRLGPKRRRRQQVDPRRRQQVDPRRRRPASSLAAAPHVHRQGPRRRHDQLLQPVQERRAVAQAQGPAAEAGGRRSRRPRPTAPSSTACTSASSAPTAPPHARPSGGTQRNASALRRCSMPTGIPLPLLPAAMVFLLLYAVSV
jgi:hypothetical protein